MAKMLQLRSGTNDALAEGGGKVDMVGRLSFLAAGNQDSVNFLNNDNTW